MLRLIRLLPAALVALFLIAASAAANDITVDFTGTITGTSGSSPFAVNDTFSGSYTFSSAATDSNPTVGVGDYRYTTSPYGETVNIDGYTISTSPSVNFLIEVENNYANQDAYAVNNYANNFNGPIGYTVNAVAFDGLDSTQTLFSSEALPLTPPSLSSFTSQIFEIQGTAINVFQEQQPWDATGVLQTLTVDPASVPEPPTLLLLGIGLLGLALASSLKRKGVCTSRISA